MIKRVSLVWRKPGQSASEFRELWLGEHARLAAQLEGLRAYVIDFVEDPAPGDPDGIATLRFDSREALDRAFSDTALRGRLLETREAFAARVAVFIVDEQVVFLDRKGSAE